MSAYQSTPAVCLERHKLARELEEAHRAVMRASNDEVHAVIGDNAVAADAAAEQLRQTRIKRDEAYARLAQHIHEHGCQP